MVGGGNPSLIHVQVRTSDSTSHEELSKILGETVGTQNESQHHNKHAVSWYEHRFSFKVINSVYLHVTFTSACLARVAFWCPAVQMYRPECSDVTLRMTRVAVPDLFCRWIVVSLCRFLLEPGLVHVITDGRKLSTLQVRFRTSPSFTSVTPVISGLLKALKHNILDKLLEFCLRKQFITQNTKKP